MSVEQIKNSANIKKTTVTVCVEDKTTGTDTNFTYNLSNSISDVRLIEITNIEVINDAYNNNDYNNSMNWTDSLGVTHDLVLQNSNRSAGFLIRQLQTQMEADKDNSGLTLVNYTVRFDEVDTITFGTYQGVTRFDLNFSLNTDTNIANSLGFGTTDFTGSTQYSSQFPIDLNYSKNLFIGSTNLMLDAFDTSEISNGSTHVLTKVEINQDYGDLIFNKDRVPIRSKIDILSTIDIRLTDDEGRDYLLERGKFTITFDIYSRIFNGGFSI
jgi:hypothetical protein